MFNHVDIDLPKLSRETIDGVRYYNVPDEDELIKLVSITSITSHFNKQIFLDWRKIRGWFIRVTTVIIWAHEGFGGSRRGMMSLREYLLLFLDLTFPQGKN